MYFRTSLHLQLAFHSAPFQNVHSVLRLSDLYGRQKPVSPFSTSSLNCWTQSRKATMAWSNLLSQKNLRPPEQYRGSSWTNTRQKERAELEPRGVHLWRESCVGKHILCTTLDLSVSDSKYEWFPYGTRRYLRRESCYLSFLLPWLRRILAINIHSEQLR